MHIDYGVDLVAHVHILWRGICADWPGRLQGGYICIVVYSITVCST